MNPLYRQIRITSLPHLLYALFMLLLTSYMFYSIPFFDFVYPVQISDPSSITDLYQNNISCVELTADTLYYSGYDYIENGRTAGAYYYSLKDGNCVFFLLGNSQCASRQEILTDITVKARLQSGGRLLSELIQQMSADLNWTPQGLSSVSSHIIGNAADYLLFKHMAFFAVVLIVFILSLLAFFYIVAYIIFPILHPACLRLRRYGSVKEMTAEAGEELLEKPLLTAGIFTITEHYLIASSKIQLYILPLDKIVWAYKHSSFHRFRFKRQRITYTLRVIAKKKLTLIAAAQTKRDVDAVLTCISECNPGALIEYSRENERLARLHR